MNKVYFKFAIYLWLLGLFLLFFMYGAEIYSEIKVKYERQEKINKNISQVKHTYEALKPTIKVWNEAYTSSDEIIDVVSLYKALNVESSGLMSKDNDLSEGRVSSVLYKGKDIGLMKRCIKNTNRGFSVYSHSINGLLNGIEQLESRHDVYWESVNIRVEKQLPTAIFSELCINVRLRGGNA
jgi:hypothetical protein